MPKFFKPKQIDAVMQLRLGAGYLILKTGDSEALTPTPITGAVYPTAKAALQTLRPPNTPPLD